MTIHQLRVPVASVQGTLALDLSPRHAPPDLPDVPGPRRRSATWCRSTRVSAAGSSSGCTATSRPRSRSWAATGRRASCCAGPRGRLRRPAPPSRARGARRRPPARRTPGPAGAPARGERAHQLRQPDRRRGERPDPLRRKVSSTGPAVREARGPVGLLGDGVRLSRSVSRTVVPRSPRPRRATARRPRRRRPPGRGSPARPPLRVQPRRAARPAPPRGCGVEVAGRLVGEQHVGMGGQRPGQATRCCWPPDSSSTRCSAHSSSPTTASASRARLSASAG